MKLYKNIEDSDFRITLTLETNDTLGHKILSESEESREAAENLLNLAGEPIIMLLKQAKTARKL